MLIDKVYKTVSLLVNKNQLSGYLPPDEFNQYSLFAQREYIDSNYSRIDGRGYESTYKVTDEMSKVKKQTSISLSSGRASRPADYLHFSHAQANFIFNGVGAVVPIELVRDDEWAERLASEVNKPSRRFPIMRSMDTYFEVSPTSLNNISLTYIKDPLEPWWNYTLVGSTPTFAATGGVTTNPNSGVTAGDSTDFEIDDFKWLVWRICLYFGVETENPNTYQASKQEGQDI